MKGFILLVSVPAVIFLGLVVATFMLERRRVARRHRGRRRRARVAVPALAATVTDPVVPPSAAVANVSVVRW